MNAMRTISHLRESKNHQEKNPQKTMLEEPIIKSPQVCSNQNLEHSGPHRVD